MDKYRKVVDGGASVVDEDVDMGVPKTDEVGDGSIRVASKGKVHDYVLRATSALKEGGSGSIIICGIGRSITKTVSVVEITKRRVAGLHQNTRIYYKNVTDVWAPTEPGLDRIRVTRHTPAIQITLSLTPLDPSVPGYQPPIYIDPVASRAMEEEDAASHAQRKPKKPRNRNSHGDRMEVDPSATQTGAPTNNARSSDASGAHRVRGDNRQSGLQSGRAAPRREGQAARGPRGGDGDRVAPAEGGESAERPLGQTAEGGMRQPHSRGSGGSIRGGRGGSAHRARGGHAGREGEAGEAGNDGDARRSDATRGRDGGHRGAGRGRGRGQPRGAHAQTHAHTPVNGTGE